MTALALNIVRAIYLSSLVSDMRLTRPTVYDSLDPQQISDAYDGIGCSSSWSTSKREALTSAFREYEPCVLIDDVAIAYGVSESVANVMLLDNLKKAWAYKFGFFRWLKPKALTERRIILPELYRVIVESRNNED